MKTKILSVGIVCLMLLAGLGVMTAEAVRPSPIRILPMPARGPPGPTIVEFVLEANSDGMYEGEFDTLIAALLAADPAVINKLNSPGQYTVFAPNDTAFEKLGLNETNIGEALPQDVLTNILLYHVAHGRLDSEEVLEHDRINTLIRGPGGFLMQYNATLTDNLGRESNIVVVDLFAGNGVIHVIDTVLLPMEP